MRADEATSPAVSRAVLFGCHSYRHETDVPAVKRNLAKLYRMLTDPAWALPGLSVDVVDTRSSPDQALEAVEKAADEAEGTLIVYFAGHGLVHPDTGELYLALRNSRRSRRWVPAALRYDDLRRIMLNAPADNKVLLLDCCFSGRAMAGDLGGAGNVADLAAIGGTCVTTSSSETELSFALPEDDCTVFTGALVDVLAKGVHGAGPTLSMETVYRNIDARLRERGLPLPQQRNRNDGAHIPLTLNPAFLPGTSVVPPGTPRAARRRPERPLQKALRRTRVHLRWHRRPYVTVGTTALALAACTTLGPIAYELLQEQQYPVREPGLLRSGSSGDDCLNHDTDPLPDGRTAVEGCDATEPMWTKDTYENGHVRFNSRVNSYICLGANTAKPELPVGTWGCLNRDSAWILDRNSDSSFFLRNEYAVKKGWEEQCVARSGTGTYLDRCRDDEAHTWRFSSLG